VPLLPAAPRKWSWPDLMRHTFAVGVLACPRCGGACTWSRPSRTPWSSGGFSPTSGSRPRPRAQAATVRPVRLGLKSAACRCRLSRAAEGSRSAPTARPRSATSAARTRRSPEAEAGRRPPSARSLDEMDGEGCAAPRRCSDIWRRLGRRRPTPEQHSPVGGRGAAWCRRHGIGQPHGGRSWLDCLMVVELPAGVSQSVLGCARSPRHAYARDRSDHGGPAAPRERAGRMIAPPAAIRNPANGHGPGVAGEPLTRTGRAPPVEVGLGTDRIPMEHMTSGP
jgi:hypothetical protein